MKAGQSVVAIETAPNPLWFIKSRHPVLTCTALAQVTYDLLETRGGWRGRVGLLLIDSLLMSHSCDCRCRCNKYPDISAARGSKGLFLRRVVTHLCSGLWIRPILEA